MSLPSCGERFRRSRALLRVVAALSFTVAILAAGLVFAASALSGSESVRAQVESAIERMSGVPMRAELGEFSLSLDPSRFLALRVSDVRLVAAEDDSEVLEAGDLRFGIRILPLMTGQVRLGSASIEDARITIADPGPNSDLLADLRNGEGLIDPGKAPDFFFLALRQAFDALDRGETDRLDLANVDVVFPPSSPRPTLGIVTATVSRSGDGGLGVSAAMHIDTVELSLEGEARRAVGQQRIESVSLALSSSRIIKESADRKASWGGAARLSLRGSESLAGVPSQLRLEAALDELSLAVPAGETAGSLTVSGVAVQGVPKFEVASLDMLLGRSRLRFQGAVGPNPPGEEAEGPDEAYRFDLVSDVSTLAPTDSPERALPVSARTAGLFIPAESRLVAEQIGVRTEGGAAYATGEIVFNGETSPAYALNLDVERMPVAHAKQIWPWLSARGARNWVLKNLYGGTIVESSLRLKVGAGRFGDGIPLNAEELEGHFELVDTRFDIAGDLPAVRDASGSLDVSGTRVAISLAEGAAFMVSGRKVEVSDGTLLLADTHREPVIGKLDIAVSGEAADVVEFASTRPIDAMRRLQMRPEEFTGTVEGRVQLDFPLARDVRVADLEWRVALNYKDLSLAREFEGQNLSDAAGTITVDRETARIVAKGRLNGIPATLDLTEPIDADASLQRRDIALTLDDKARALIAPGLKDLLSGPVILKLEGKGAGRQTVEADLSRARLSLPWIGWSKGAGVSANVSFDLATEGANARLTDFNLKAASFSAVGDIRLAKGALQSAKFSSVRLNKGDDAAISVQRAGKGYEVSVTGEAFDARSSIKQLLSSPAATEESVAGTPIRIDLSVGRLGGFGGEAMRNVKLVYSGTGAKAQALEISAVSASGGAVSVRNASSGGRRSVQVQSADAGAILRFLDIYPRMEGGTITVALEGDADVLKGPVDARNFDIVNEPRLKSLVGTAAPEGNGRTLSQAVRKEIDVSRATFERGYALVEKRTGFLAIDNGVIRGPLIGATFQGTLYDQKDRMAMTGTFMPAYGLNRIFAEIPLVGAILGNGRDRGLIGITFKLAGQASSPQLQVNPISVIAPGVFRQIFEF